MRQGRGRSIGSWEELCDWSALTYFSHRVHPFVDLESYIDNTNRDVQTRKYYLDIAKRLHVPAR